MKPQPLALLIALLAIAAGVVSYLRPPKLGLDIRGGARVVLKADTSKLPPGQTWDQKTKSAVNQIIMNRVNANGVAEPVITPKGVDQFVVELPDVRNQQEILDQLQNTAQLQFFYSNEWASDRNKFGRYSINAEPGVTGQREQFKITDNTAKQTFRDRFNINLALREMIEAGEKAGSKAVLTTLPGSLSSLSAAQAKKEWNLTPEDSAKVAALAQELESFDAFLKAARLELTGNDLLPNAAGGFNPSGSGAQVELEFNSKGKDKFAQFTKDHTEEILMIYLDGRILMAPRINQPILNGRAVISPFATVREAKQLADYLNGGALPVPLEIAQLQTVEATLGSEAVRQGLMAGIVGFGLVALFMLGYYLLPGAVAVIALALYTLFTYAVFVLVPVTFTLPGIAGFILSVGMAVDANILIFERTKEELRAGKPLKQAVEAGFGRAFSAIFDSNMCTAVTSLLLYNFGTGPVRGFALTLLLGVAISMFTAITVTRTLLLLLLNAPFAQNLKSWGIDRMFIPRLQVTMNRKLWYGLSLAIIVPGLIALAMGGFKPGIDFTGGSELTLKFAQSKSVSREDLEKAVRAQGIEDPSVQLSGGNEVYVRIPRQKAEGGTGLTELNRAQAQSLVEKLATQFPGVTMPEFNSIGSSISTELTRNAGYSIFLSSLFIVLYLAFRFALGSFTSGLKYGFGAIVAMLHDVLVLVGLFSILGLVLNWKVDSLFVTALLTVIGFSVHDTIIIFDRIRENLKLRRGEEYGATIDHSINETFTRSINTSLTVVITLIALLIFGGSTIRPLNAALLIGIVSGTYSSIFNAAPLVYDLDRLFGRKKKGAATAQEPIRPRTTSPKPATTSASRADRPTTVVSATEVPASGTFVEDDSSADDGPGSVSGGQRGTRPASTLPPGAPRPRKRRM